MPTPEDNFDTSVAGHSSTMLFSRMSLMMFLQYGSLGVWGVTIPTYIAANTGDAGAGLFSPGFVGYSAMAGAVGSLISPALLGFVSDRYFSAQRLVAAAHFGCAISAFGMYLCGSQTSYFLWLLAYFQFFVPTVTLTNKIALCHLRNIDDEFARVRALGTAGWMTAGLLVGFIWPSLFGDSIEATRVPLLIGVGGNVIMALYSLTLPHTPPEKKKNVDSKELAASRAQMLQNRPFVVFLIVSMLATIPGMAYTTYGNPFLNYKDYTAPAAIQSFGQLSEVIFMWIMPWFLARISLKWLFIVGVLSWGVRYVFLAMAASLDLTWAAYASILIHGPCFVFIYVGGQIYIDRLAPLEHRGAAQGLHALATVGLGHLLGAMATGYTQEILLTPEGVTPAPYRWTEFWIIPAVMSVATAILFKFAFKPPGPDNGPPVELHVDDLPPSPADALAEPHEA